MSETASPLFLPYEFDTRSHGRAILRAVTYITLAFVLLIGIVLLGLDNPALRLWVPLVLAGVAALQLGFALMIFRAAGGASGTVGKEQVTIEPDRFMGLTARTHRGSFATAGYEAVELRGIGLQGKVGVISLIPADPTKTPLIVLSALPYEDAKQHAGFLHKELGFRLVKPS